MELLLSEEEVPDKVLVDVMIRSIHSQEVTPVYLGTAFKNKGVQLLLNAICAYLPSPLQVETKAKDWEDQSKDYPLLPDPSKPFVGMGFKIVEEAFGQLTFMRIYQGTIKKGETYYNQRTGKNCLLYTSPSPRDS